MQPMTTWPMFTGMMPMNPWNPWCMPMMPTPMPMMQQATIKTNTLVNTQYNVKPKICKDNTTIIADTRLALLKQDDPSWVVQLTGNMSFAQCTERIKQSQIITDKKYVFVALGSKQVYTGQERQMRSDVHNLVNTIIDVNAWVKVFLLPVLPRLVDNHYAKQYIIEFNKILSNAVKAMKNQGLQVNFLPIQNQFIVNGLPDERMFEPDGLTLNTEGCRLFKHRVFVAAGFKKN